MLRKFILLSALLASAGVAAVETAKLSAFQHFEKQKSVILKDISTNTVYNEISYSDMKMVQQTLDLMSSTLEGVTDVNDLTEDQKADLFNNQGVVNTILTMAENDSRMVCRRRSTLGTNFKTTTCETVRDRRERQQADRHAIDRFLRGTPLETN